jgi:hypothetical protein
MNNNKEWRGGRRNGIEKKADPWIGEGRKGK